MKKVVAVVATVIATAAVLVAGASAKGEATPLYEERGTPCGLLDRDGSGVSGTTVLLVHRKNGNVYLRCEAQGTPGSTVHMDTGFLCGLGQFGLTTQSQNRVGKSGGIQLECWGYSDPNRSELRTASSGGNGAG